MVDALVRRWWLLVAAAALGAAAAAGRELARDRVYTSSATFVLQGARAAPSFAGIASQFGISLPTSDGGQSPALYVQILRSRSVLGAIAHADYCDPCAPAERRRSLAELLGVTQADTLRTTSEAIRWLRNAVSGGVDPKTGLVSVSATSTSAAVAQQIVARALLEVTRFNQQSRQSQAGAERRFTEGRLEAIGGELRSAEQRLRAFRESNRSTLLSPELALREGQLEREVRRYEEVYSALARSLEQTKIDELRDTPAVMVVDPPAFPDRPDPRGLLLKSVFAGLLGGIAAAVGVAWSAARRLAPVG